MVVGNKFDLVTETNPYSQVSIVSIETSDDKLILKNIYYARLMHSIILLY